MSNESTKVNSETLLNVNEEGFFGNKNVPQFVKNGMIALFLHAQVNFLKKDGKETFMALLFDERKRVNGTMSFTFGMPESMATGNRLASLKQLEKMYPGIENIFGAENDEKILSDAEICDKVAKASAKRYKLSAEGSIGNFEKYVLGDFSSYRSKINSYYPGVVSSKTFDNLIDTFEQACGFKKTNSSKQIKQQ